MGYRFFIYVSLVLLFADCKKDPQIIIHKVLGIKAGDSTSADVHYMRINYEFNGWSNTDYYLRIDMSNSYDFHFVYYYVMTNPELYDYGFQLNPGLPENTSYIYLDSKGYPVALNFGEMISDTLRWTVNRGYRTLYDDLIDHLPNGVSYYSGNWIKNPNGYLAFKVIDMKSDLTYKGWVLFGIKWNGDQLIKSCAYVVY
jgi:hypothetical protein